jgi:hypothetical protein
MTVRNDKIRFMANSWIKLLDSSRVTYSSQLTAFPYTNSQNDIRSKVFKFSGRFTITATTKYIYINDGSDKTIELSAGEYTTPTILAAHIQTQLNASSSNWTCTYSTTTFKFTIANTGSVTLRLSETTSSTWNILGFTTSSDLTDTSFVANEQRNHTSESIVWDLGSSAPITFFAVIGKVNETFNISDTATITLQANSVNDFSSPPLDETLTRTDLGIFKFLDDLTDYTYRYWKFEITDVLNTIGPNISISHIYLGDYLDFTNRGVAHGYGKTMTDPSNISISECGSLYADSKPKFTNFSDLRLDILERSNKDYLEAMFYKVGKTIPFYCSIDPLGTYTTNLHELTKFVFFNSEPVFIHTFRDMFSTSISLREGV